MNPIKLRREFLELSFKVALDQMEREWENSSQAAPTKGAFEFKVTLEDGQELSSGGTVSFGKIPKPVTH